MAFGAKTNEREGTRAVLRNCPGSASKVRVVLDLIRGLDVQSARDVLEFCERDAATIVGKLLDSAIANAEHNDELVGEELFVSACYADEARTQKRFKPRARGRAGKIFKRSSHITIIVSRLPEDRLARIKAKAEAAQTERRNRRASAGPERGRRARVAASQKADAGRDRRARSRPRSRSRRSRPRRTMKSSTTPSSTRRRWSSEATRRSNRRAPWLKKRQRRKR